MLWFSDTTDEWITMPKHIMYSLAATVLWGIWAILAKLASIRIGHWPSVLVYTLFSTATVTILFLSTSQSLRNSGAHGILFAGVSGIVGGLAIVFFQKAVSCGPVSTSTALTALYPVLAVIFGVFFLKENLSTINTIGVFLAIAAGVLISI